MEEKFYVIIKDDFGKKWCGCYEQAYKLVTDIFICCFMNEITDPHLIFTRRRSLRVNGGCFARQQGQPDAKFATLRVALQHNVRWMQKYTLYSLTFNIRCGGLLKL